MFPHKSTNTFYTKLAKSASWLKIFDIYDKSSPIREYVLDNVFVCIFMYVLFYLAIWYARKITQRIEEKNEEMLVSVERNRTRLDEVIALKDKRLEYETFVIKAKEAQKETTLQLDGEMTRLSSELVLTMDKLVDLENFLTQIIFSGSFGNTAPSEQRKSSSPMKMNSSKEIRQRYRASKKSRYSNRRSHRQRRPSRRHGSSGSLHDRPRQPPAAAALRRLGHRKSDSSTRASAEETSSTESSYLGTDPLLLSFQSSRSSHSN